MENCSMSIGPPDPRCDLSRLDRLLRDELPDAGVGGSRRWRFELLGQQIRGDIGHRIAEPRVKPERIGIEAVLE